MSLTGLNRRIFRPEYEEETLSVYRSDEGVVGDVDPFEWNLFGLGPGKQ
jgi:hypothetical protein